MKVALYARVSSKASSKRKIAKGKDRERQDPEVQLVKLHKYAHDHGYEIFKEYVDRASGAKMSRPALDQMLDDAKARKFDKIIIVRLDRMMRSTINFVNVVQELNSYNVALVCTEQAIDTSQDSPYARLTMNIFMAFAEFERELICERSKDGYEKAIADGKQIGRPNKTGLDEKIVFEALRDRSLDKAAEVLKVKKSTLRYYVRKMGGLSEIRQKQGVKIGMPSALNTPPSGEGEGQFELNMTPGEVK